MSRVDARYLVCSDVHGDADCFARVVTAFERENCRKMLILGDLLYHGPRNDLPAGYAPKTVIGQANALRDRIVMVRGNCEAEVDEMVLEFPIRPRRSLTLCGHRVYLVHGHHLEEQRTGFLPGSIVFFGHTHVPFAERRDGVLYLNPGSVSIPKDGSERSYLILSAESAVFYDLAGRELRRVALPTGQE